MDAAKDAHELDIPVDVYMERLVNENEQLVQMVKSLLAEVEQYETKLAEGKQQIAELQDLVKEQR